MAVRRRRRGSNTAESSREENDITLERKSRWNLFWHSLTFQAVFGFEAKELASWEGFVRLLYRPADPASLAIVRFLFGLLMVLDIPDERGLGEADVRWATPLQCYFPLFNFLRPPPLPYMCLIYLAMWAGAVGIMLGYRFRLSCALFAVPYWFVFLLEKSRWNNHSYLYGLLAILLSRSSAHHCFSVDALRHGWRYRPAPLWNYTALRFQFFMLYFLAGVKKLDSDWLGGYSMVHLSNHWVFAPFKLVLTPEQTDFWIVHITGFTLDLTIGFWMFLDATRPLAFIFCAMFHLMNSRLFMIGMFPYVCLATMPLFCHNDWPRRLGSRLMLWRKASQPKRVESYPWEDPVAYEEVVIDAGCLLPLNKEFCSSGEPTKSADYAGVAEGGSPQGKRTSEDTASVNNNVNNRRNAAGKLTWCHHLTAALLLSHAGMQFFLPYSHFVTQGYNTWTNGLYGYSWDMMVHTWDTILVVVKVVEKESGKEHFLDPEVWVHSDRWAKHADMAKQYAHCVERNLRSELVKARGPRTALRSENVSIYLDVWCSLNGRFQQRMYDPRVDLLSAPWSPFEKVSWVMPLLSELSPWRARIRELEQEVHSWSNHSDALFVADFPGLYLENYITAQLDNVTVTVLAGSVELELNPFIPGSKPAKHVPRENVTLHEGESARVPRRAFHRVHVTSQRPACYMYSYTNLKRMREDKDTINKSNIVPGIAGEVPESEDPVKDKSLMGSIRIRARLFKRAIALVSNAVLNVLYSVPMVKRIRVG